MGQPRGHHFLPRSAHLGFFENPARPGYLYLYRRGQEPVEVNSSKVGKERDLYAFVDETGQRNVALERILGDLENRAKPILERLNAATAHTQITVLERHTLLDYVATLAARTPAFRGMLDQVVSQMVMMPLRLLASQPGAIEAFLEGAKRDRPGQFDDLTVEDLRQLALGQGYKVRAKPALLLWQTVMSVKAIYGCLRLKLLSVFRAEESFFITSDHPVVQVPDPGAPALVGSGFLMSGIFVAVGSHAGLWLAGEEERRLSSPDQQLVVPVTLIEKGRADFLNRLSMLFAEDAILACARDEEMRRVFDRTPKPERVRFSGLGFEDRPDSPEP